VTRLAPRRAEKAQDGHRLLEFRCLPDPLDEDEAGEEDPAPHFEPEVRHAWHPLWMLEIDHYIRVVMLANADHVLVFETEVGELAGVSAFDREDVPIGWRMDAGWRLQVIALALPWQRTMVEADIDGCPPTMRASEFVLRGTFRYMLEVDAQRLPVVGRIHVENRPSIIACARVGLDLQERDPTSEYWPIWGQADPTARPTR
jgi:hypothetical protein